MNHRGKEVVTHQRKKRMTVFLTIVLFIVAASNVIAEEPVAHAAERFYATLDAQNFVNTNLLNATPLSSRNTNPGDLPFDLVNASMLWYDIQVTHQDVPINPANSIFQDTESAAYLGLDLLPPNTTTPFDCFCLISSQDIEGDVTFTQPNQTVTFTLNPFTGRAATLDAITIILYLIGDVGGVPFAGLLGPNAVKIILDFASIPTFTYAVNELLASFESLPNIGAATSHSLNFLRDLYGLLNSRVDFEKLATALDKLLGGNEIDISFLGPITQALDGLSSWVGKATALYHLATFLTDEALTMGQLLTTGANPTVTLKSVGVGPTNGSTPTITGYGTPSPGNNTKDNSQIFSSSPSLIVQPDQRFNMSFTYKNTGTSTWTDAAGYALGCDTYYHHESNCMGGSSIGLGGQNVAPGQQYTFNLTLTAPSSPGTYTTWWDMTHNGSIFGNNNSSVQVTVQQQQQEVDNSQWIANSSPVTVQPGQQFSIYFTYKNDGTTTWSDGGGYALSCDTFYHSNSNCMGGSPIGFGRGNVSPGQQFTFNLTLIAPSSSGTYYTYWDMTHNGSIFGNNNSYVQVNVQSSPPPVDNSRWISNSPTQNVIPGQQFTIQFTYENDGTTTWTDGGGYALNCDMYYHGNNNNCMGGGPVGLNGQSIAPGQQYTFTLNLTAPSSTGTYYTWWDMTHNGSIFGNNNSYVQVNVQAPVDNSQWVSNSPSQNVQPGQQFTIQFTYENDGTTIWTDGGGYALNCDMYYHGNNNDCMGGGPVGLNGQTVAPGQQYKFTLTLTAPSASGTYYTWWDMTHNGSIFGNNNSYVVVNVQ
jgi:hypothetical protein